MKSGKGKALAIIAVILLAGIYYYVSIPAINIHASGLWFFFLAIIIAVLIAYAVKKHIRTKAELHDFKVMRYGLLLLGAVFAVYLIGSLLSSPIINAKKYQSLITVESRDFTEDIQPVNYSQIPLLDKDSAELLGNRKMGSMVDYVSQFEVSSLYSQINYKGQPVRVTPLVYASAVKWITNQKNGIPAYIMIDMATQDTQLVKLTNGGIRYSQSEYFNRNINRHLRFRYPTYIFDQLSFEIDDDGVPYWICPVKDFTIGLFGGQTIGRVVLCNAVTGETKDYAIGDCPAWVDRAYPADLLVQLYDYYGTLKNGYFNSLLGQKGCLKTTDGYNYLAMDDDVWVYTGITSVSGDRSNVGFVLMNQRTQETRYYEVNGAEEYSAMDSAQGQVQNLGYNATFPLLLNIQNEPTYFMALKDDAGLVKKYAMVNIQKYQNVAIGDTVQACEKSYIQLLNQNGITTTDDGAVKSVTGKIDRIAQSVIDGNSHFYLVLAGEPRIYDVPVVDFIQVVACQVGDTVTIRYIEGDAVSTVTDIEKKS